jgi:hypothetical protein
MRLRFPAVILVLATPVAACGSGVDLGHDNGPSDGGEAGSTDATTMDGGSGGTGSSSGASSSSSGSGASSSSSGGGDAGCREAGAQSFVAGSAACTNDTPIVFGDAATGYSTCTPTPNLAGTTWPLGLAGSGTVHRASVVGCPNLVVPASAGTCFDISSACKSNADCADAGPNAACSAFGPGGMPNGIPGYCGCVAGCLRDSDCNAGEVCVCTNPLGACIPASCTSDAQCGPGFLCALTDKINLNPDCGVGGPALFACQTTQDTCLMDSDCTDCTVTGSCGMDGNGPRVCAMTCPSHMGP